MHGTHGRALLHTDEHVAIPVSAGVPTGVRLSFVASIMLAMIVVGMVIGSSYANHVWPSVNSLKVPL